jgi:hypothetical protein
MLRGVAFLAMEPPTGLHSEAVRDEQVKVFRSIPPLDPKNLVRGCSMDTGKKKQSHLNQRWRRLCPWAPGGSVMAVIRCPGPDSRRKLLQVTKAEVPAELRESLDSAF